MARTLLPDDLWAIIQPLLPSPPPPSPKGGRPPLPDRPALTGILFVLRTGLPWEDLPAELGCGGGMSCWRRLRDWQADGTWTRVHGPLLERLHSAGTRDGSKCVIDSSRVPAVFGGPRPAPTRRAGALSVMTTSQSGDVTAASRNSPVLTPDVGSLPEPVPPFCERNGEGADPSSMILLTTGRILLSRGIRPGCNRRAV